MSNNNVLINFVIGGDESLDQAADKLDNMTEAEKKLADQAKKTYGDMDNAQKRIASSIDKLADASKTMDKSIIAGAYKDYLKTIQKELGLTEKELKNYIKNARQAAQQGIIGSDDAKQVKELEVSLEVLNDVLKEYEQESEKASKTSASLRARLKAMREELIALEDAGEQNTDRYRQLSQEAGDLDDQIKDLNSRISTLGSDTKGVDALISGLSGIAGGFAIVQGSMALFGQENEEIEKALLKVNAAMAILQGLQEVQNVLQKESAAMIALNTLKTNIQTAATNGATVAQRAYNVALAASPILIAITAISALVLVYKQLNKELTEAEQKAKLNIEVEEKALDGYVKSKVQLEVLTKRVREAGLSFQDKKRIVKDYNREFGDSIGKAKSFDEAQRMIIQRGPAFIETLRAQSMELAAFGLAVEAGKKSLELSMKPAEEYLDGIDKINYSFVKWLANAKAFKGQIGFNFISESAKEDIETFQQMAEIAKFNAVNAEDNKQNALLEIYEKYRKEREERQKKYGFKLTAEEQKEAEDALKKAREAAKRRLEEIKAGIDAEIIELRRTGKAQDEIYLKRQKDAIDAQTALTLFETKGAKQRLLVVAQAEEEKRKLTNEFNLKNAEDNLETQRKQIDAEYAAAREGSNEQLKLKKEQLQNEADQEEIRVRASELNEKDKVARVLAINKKLKGDLQKLDEDDQRQKLQYQSDIKALKNQADIISKQRDLIGVKDKKQLAKINKELSDIRLAGIQDEIDQNENLYEKKLISDEEYQKNKLSLTEKYSSEENTAVKDAYDERERIIHESYDRINRSIESTFSLINQSIDQTIVNGDGIKAALGSAMQAYQEFIKIQQSDAEQSEKNRQIAVAAVGAAQQTINGIFSDAARQRQSELDAQLSALDAAKEKELSDKSLTEEQKDQINEKYRKKEAAAKRQAWEADRRARKSQAVINTALAVINALATAPTIIAGIALAAVAAFTGGVQIAKINAEPVPKFRKGKVNITGPGSGTSDSIPAMISNGESVINAKSTSKWADALTAINDDKFEHWLDHRFGDFTYPEVPAQTYKTFEDKQASGGINYDMLAAALAKKIPEPTYVQNSFDEGGFYSWVVKGNNRRHYKNKRYSMQ